MTEMRTRWLLAVLAGVVLAALTGAVAAWAQAGTDHGLRFVTFAVMTLPVWVGLARLVTSTEPRAPHAEESVEMQWITVATSGAFTDLLLVLGLATTATSVLGTDSVPSVAFLVVAMADVAARYVVLQRREG